MAQVTSKKAPHKSAQKGDTVAPLGLLSSFLDASVTWKKGVLLLAGIQLDTEQLLSQKRSIQGKACLPTIQAFRGELLHFEGVYHDRMIDHEK